jgi:hypothetical protein
MMDLHSTSRPFGFLILAAGLYGIWSVRLTSDVSLTIQLNPSKKKLKLCGEKFDVFNVSTVSAFASK